MTLERKSLNLVLYQGIDTKTNEKLVEDKLLEMENCEINNQEVVKSPGGIFLAQNQTANSDPVDQKGLVNAFGTMIVADNNKLYKYNNDQDVLNETGNLVFAEITKYQQTQNISQKYTKTTSFSQLPAPYSVFAVAPLSDYVIPAPISCQFEDYFFSCSSVIISSNNNCIFQVSLTKISTNTTIYKGLFRDSASVLTYLPQDCVGTPSGVFMYAVDPVTGKTNEYYLAYDLSVVHMKDSNPESADIFPANPILYPKRGAVAPDIINLTSYINMISVEYSDGYILFAFRSGLTTDYTGYIASRNLAGLGTLAPTSIVINEIFNLAPSTQTLCTCVFYHPDTQAKYFAVTFHQRTFIIPVQSMTTAVFNSNDIAVDFINAIDQIHSTGFLEKTREFVLLAHKITEFVSDTPASTNITTPFVNLVELTQTSGIKLAATKTLTGENGDTRYLQIYGAAAIAGRVFCTYDKILVPVFYFAYLTTTPNKDKRNSAHLVQLIPTYDIPPNPPTPLIEGHTNYSHVSWIQAFSCSIYNAGTNYSSPPALLKTKIFGTDATNTFCGFYVESKVESNAGQVSFEHVINAYKYSIPKYFAFNGFNRSSFYFGYGKINELTSSTFSEQNFFDFPEFSVTATAAGAVIGAGTYIYAAHYEWTNGNNEVVRSEVQELLYTLVADAASITLSFTPPPFFSEKSGIVVKIYRSTKNGSVPFLLTSLATLNYSYTDDNADAAINNNEIVYTYGGILGDQPFPAVRAFTLFKDCIFAIDAVEPNRIRYSKTRTEGVALATNDALSFLVDTRDGEATNLGVIDNKLIIFKRNSIYVVEGDPPTQDGLNSTLSLPQYVSSPVGCSQIETLVTFPEGLIFKSLKGLWQLDRSLNSIYIGADVERYNSLNITSAQCLTSVNKIKFTTSENIVLVFDYYYRTWNIESYKSGILDSDNVDNSLTMIFEDGTILKQDSSKFLRGQENFNMKFTTGWIKLAGLSGFQRLYKILFLGNYIGKHVLKVSVYYDYAKDPLEYHYFNPSQNLGVFNAYGNSGWGEIRPYGGYKDSLYLFRINVRQQKCIAVKLSIEDVFTGELDTTGASFKATNLNFDIGIKSPTAKVPSRLQV